MRTCCNFKYRSASFRTWCPLAKVMRRNSRSNRSAVPGQKVDKEREIVEDLDCGCDVRLKWFGCTLIQHRHDWVRGWAWQLCHCGRRNTT
jgi:hypothetical protein